MEPAEFRRLALSLPDAIEGSHMGHADFRVGGKIFATLGYPDDEHGVVMLPADEQKRLMGLRADVFTPAVGAWGRQGATQVRLELADQALLQSALASAWQKRAPKRLTL